MPAALTPTVSFTPSGPLPTVPLMPAATHLAALPQFTAPTLLAAPLNLAAALFAALASLFTLPPIVPATYFAGSVILLIGLVVALRREMPRASGLDKLLCLGPVFFAAPLAVFGAEHLTVTRAMTGMVPHWIPWHFFWVVFVGLALEAAALSLAVRRVDGPAAALLGVMFFCFVVLMALPGLVGNPHNRFAWTLTFRETTFSLCSFAYASTVATGRWRAVGERLAVVARTVVGAVLIFYGAEHFLHPQFVPVIPLELPLPAWMPLHPVIAYGTGAALVAAGLALLANWHARAAATLLGVLITVVVLLVYLPILAVHPADIAVGMNYFADTLFFGGGILMLAGSIPGARCRQPAVSGEPTAASCEQPVASR